MKPMPLAVTAIFITAAIILGLRLNAHRVAVQNADNNLIRLTAVSDRTSQAWTNCGNTATALQKTLNAEFSSDDESGSNGMEIALQANRRFTAIGNTVKTATTSLDHDSSKVSFPAVIDAIKEVDQAATQVLDATSDDSTIVKTVLANPIMAYGLNGANGTEMGQRLGHLGQKYATTVVKLLYAYQAAYKHDYNETLVAETAYKNLDRQNPAQYLLTL